MQPDGAIEFEHDSSQKGLPRMAKSSEPGPRRRRPQSSGPVNPIEKIPKPLSGFQMPKSPPNQTPVQKSAEPEVPELDQSEKEASLPREKISAKNRATSIIQSQRRLQNSKKQVLSQAAATLIGSSDSSSDEEMELSYRSSQRLRTSTQAPGGAPIPKIISGSSQSQVQIQKTVINESTAIVPDTQDQTTKPKFDQTKIVIPDSDEESSSEHQTRLSRMSQEGFQKDSFFGWLTATSNQIRELKSSYSHRFVIANQNSEIIWAKLHAFLPQNILALQRHHQKPIRQRGSKSF